MLQKLRSNWKSGLAVSLVSIPLSISLAVASQVSPVQGIITAIWAGLMSALFGGSNFNIIGPTGALSGIIASFVLTHGAHQVSMLAIITGLLIFLAYLFHVERYLIFIPSSVIYGFTLGVAGIIAFNQIHFVLGLPSAHHHVLIENVWESLTHIRNASFGALSVFILFFSGLRLARKFVPWIPAIVILAPLGIAFGYFAPSASLSLQTLGTLFGAINFSFFQLPAFALSRSLVSSACIVAFVAIIETMLSAKIADGMTGTKHNSRKELFGLALGNIFSGLAGGIPATAALARTSLNIKTGATHKTSAAFSSLFIALGSLVCLSYFSYLPMAVVAAILVSVAVDMVEVSHFVSLYRYDKTSFIIAMGVAFLTIWQDPIIAVLIGVAVSLLVLVHKQSVGYYGVAVDTQEDTSGEASSKKTVVYTFKGKLTYINSPAHIARFETGFTEYKKIILSFSELYFMDIDGVDAFDEIVTLLQKRHTVIEVIGLNPQIRSMLESASKTFKTLKN